MKWEAARGPILKVQHQESQELILNEFLGLYQQEKNFEKVELQAKVLILIALSEEDLRQVQIRGFS